MRAKINSTDFNRLIAATKDFAADDSIRKLHKYIRLEFSATNSTVTAIAVDGHRMSVEHSVCECDEDFSAYINKQTRLPANIPATIELTGNDAIIRCGDFIFGCPQHSGEFLDWSNAIPSGEPDFRIGVNGNYLLSALKAAKVSCGNSFRQPIILEFRSPISPIIIRTNKEDVKMVLPVRIKQNS